MSQSCSKHVGFTPDVKDFQCQTDVGCSMKTSEIIDVDDELFENCETKDVSTDPVFDDKILVENLENKIR